MRRRKPIRLAGAVSLTLVFFFLLMPMNFGEQSSLPSTPVKPAMLETGLDGSLPSSPLVFIQNKGQLETDVRFHVASTGHTVLFHNLSVEFRGSSVMETGELVRSEVSMAFEGAMNGVTLSGYRQLSGTANFYRGNDSSDWQTHVPTFEEIRYEGLYDGIDLVFTGASGSLKREFIVAPGANAGLIRMKYSGTDALYVRDDGVLVIETRLGRLTESAPVVYQEVDGDLRSIDGAFKLVGDLTLGFEIGTYNVNLPLVIDPEFSFVSYLGGSGFDLINAVDTNADGHIFVGGITNSANFPLVNANQVTLGGGFSDIFVTRIDPTTGAILYSTFLGGNDSDGIGGLEVDDSDNVYIVGNTSSTNFPTLNAVQATNNGFGEVVVAKFAPDGTLLFSTYLGGAGRDVGWGLDLDSGGNIWLTGLSDSADFPTTPDALNGSPLGGRDAFVSKLAGDGTAVLYSTYLGGAGDESGNGISIDSADDVFVAGETTSTDFTGVLSAGSTAAFVTKLINDGVSPLVPAGICTADGSGFDSASDLAVDEFFAYFGGQASAGLPTTPGSQQALFGGGGGDGMIGACKKATMEIAYLSYAGGPDFDFVTSLDVRSFGVGKGRGNLAFSLEVFYTRLISALEEATGLNFQKLSTSNVFTDALLLAGATGEFARFQDAEMSDVYVGRNLLLTVGGTNNPSESVTPQATQSISGGGFDGLITSFALSSPPGDIQGFKFMDLNSDGIFNFFDYGIGEISFELLQNNVPIDTVVTDPFGSFFFANLEPGNYQVREIIPPGFFLTTPDNPLIDVLVTSGTTSGPHIFGNGANLDYGDLPDPREDLAVPCPIGGPLSCYRTVAGVQGAAHVVHDQSIILGQRIDADPNGQPTVLADGDDENVSGVGGEDDEDGLISFTVLEGGVFQITVLVNDAIGEGGALSVFIDLNDDGVLNDGSVPGGERERVISTSVSNGINTLQSASGAIQPGDVIKHIRLRIAVQVVRFAWGLQLTGEVEDYHRSSIQTAFEYEGESDLPVSYKLFQNYPNPFSEKTAIRVELPVQEEVSLTVYDVLGRKVKVLHDGVLPPGLQEFVFDSTGLTSGVYFYSLKTDKYSKTNRMLLTR
ncbi:MAG: hypothetical protein BMS9Abin05_0614 [Rhodothermia bacterium]|nr:MAG: hypothetical protein BMS9Abin05_0614 [Rhodothermia bacterium]